MKSGNVASDTLSVWSANIWLVPDRTSTTKEPILAVVSGAGVKLQQFNHSDRTRTFSGASVRAEFSAYLGEAKPSDQYFVFMVKPSGIALFERLLKSARDKDFEVGFDSVEENKDIYFSTPQVPDDTIPVPPHPVSQGLPGGGGYSDPRGQTTGPQTTGGSGTGGPGASSRGAAASRTSTSTAAGVDGGLGNSPGSTVGGTTSGFSSGEGSGPGQGNSSTSGNGTHYDGTAQGNGKGANTGSGSNETGGATPASQGTNSTVMGPATNAEASAPQPNVPKRTSLPAPKPLSWWQRFWAWLVSLF